MKEITANIIFQHNSYGLSKDAKILVKYLDQVWCLNQGIKLKVRAVNTNSYDTGNVDINFFLEQVNPLLFHQAKVNILIPNQEWYYDHWDCYLSSIDYIWCKTHYAMDIFKDTNKAVYIGWSTPDRLSNQLGLKRKKDFVHIAGSSIYKGTQRLIDNWTSDYPTITIFYNKKNLEIKEKQQKNIMYHSTYISEEDISKIFHEHQFHICLSECEGFGHYIYEAMSCKNIVLTTNAQPMSNRIPRECLVNIEKTLPINNIKDKRYCFDPHDLERKIKWLIGLSDYEINDLASKSRMLYLETIKDLRTHLKKETHRLSDMLKNHTYLKKIPLEINSTMEDLPNISIITLTHERPEFLELMRLNYMGIDYPRNKLEWIIVDDSKTPLNIDEISKECENLKYIFLDKKYSIGKKRNIGIEKSNHSIIAFMDDDDIYYPRNLLLRLSYMIYYKKKCVGCSTLGNFDINQIISHINVPPLTLPCHTRISEASLMFYKDFWEETPFPETSHNEGGKFLENRYNLFVEINWKYIMLSLTHQKNISNRNKCLQSMEPNGCHFGLSDELFKYLINLQKYNIDY